MRVRGHGVLAAVFVIGATAGGVACTDGHSPPKPATIEWRRLAAAPTARSEVAAAVSGGRAYVVGGFDANGDTLATVDVLDVTSGVWSRGPDLPVAVNHAMAATMNDKLYVFGGYQPGNIAQSTVFRLDGSHWRAMTDLPEPRAAGTAVAIGTSVYVAGGITAGGRLADRMLVYDSSTDRWSKAPGMPTPREHLGGAAFGGRVYTVGGRTGEISNTLSTFESFDPATGQWTVLPALPTRRGGLSAAATCNGQVVAAGGEGAVESHGFHGATPTGQPASDPAGGPIGTFAQVEAFDVAAGKWRTLAPLPTPRHGLGVVAIGTVLYTLCGGPHRRPHTAEAAEAIDLAALGSCR